MGGLKLIGDWLKIPRSGELVVAYVLRLAQSQIVADILFWPPRARHAYSSC